MVKVVKYFVFSFPFVAICCLFNEAKTFLSYWCGNKRRHTHKHIKCSILHHPSPYDTPSSRPLSPDLIWPLPWLSFVPGTCPSSPPQHPTGCGSGGLWFIIHRGRFYTGPWSTWYLSTGPVPEQGSGGGFLHYTMTDFLPNPACHCRPACIWVLMISSL